MCWMPKSATPAYKDIQKDEKLTALRESTALKMADKNLLNAKPTTGGQPKLSKKAAQRARAAERKAAAAASKSAAVEAEEAEAAKEETEAEVISRLFKVIDADGKGRKTRHFKWSAGAYALLSW